MSKEKTNPLAEDEAGDKQPGTGTSEQTAARPTAPVRDKRQSAEINEENMELTKQKLKKEAHTNFIIPRTENEPVGAYETVQINQYKFTIQKGVMVNIPISVANLLAEKYRIAMDAGADKRIDRDTAVQDALS